MCDRPGCLYPQIPEGMSYDEADRAARGVGRPRGGERMNDFWTDLEALAEHWETAASRIAERALVGDPSAALAISQTLRSCAVDLRALPSEPASTGLDVERLRQALRNEFRRVPLGSFSDASLTDARRVAAEYSRLSVPSAPRDDQ